MGGTKKSSRTYRSKARTIRGLIGCRERLGERIRFLRDEAEPHWTQEGLAAKAQLDSKHLQTIESGTGNPTLATLLSISRAFGISLSELLEGV